MTRVAVLAALLVVAPSAQPQRPDPRTAQVDRMLAVCRGGPGCALAVARDGRIVYAKGYGMSNLEDSVPITPRTIFHVASVSKQFTAFAIQLLAAEGKVSLDDDIHRYLPELHDFGTPITIRHLLHHESGLRDQWALLNMAGWRSGDIITEDDILRLVWRQRALNFVPGEEESYSNTGYTLLGLIVKRVSGMSLRAFTQQRIFGPLGMTRTHFHDDNREVVPGRAYSYGADSEQGWRNVPLQYANVGATSLFTTVEDLTRWSRNFAHATVGGLAVQQAMLETGKLNNGTDTHYASGLVLKDYRGLPTIEHTGSDAGFRSDLLLFPSERLTVVVLANLASVDASGLTHRVADLYLANRLRPMPRPRVSIEPKIMALDPKLYDDYTGDFLLGSESILTFSRKGDTLWLQWTGEGKERVFPASSTDFFTKGGDERYHFVMGNDGRAQQVTFTDGETSQSASRFTRFSPTPAELGEYAGVYYSDELQVLYVLSQRDGQLTVEYPRGVVEVEPSESDAFIGPFPAGQLRFVRDSGTRAVRGFTVTNGRLRDVAFVRTDLRP